MTELPFDINIALTAKERAIYEKERDSPEGWDGYVKQIKENIDEQLKCDYKVINPDNFTPEAVWEHLTRDSYDFIPFLNLSSDKKEEYINRKYIDDCKALTKRWNTVLDTLRHPHFYTYLQVKLIHKIITDPSIRVQISNNGVNKLKELVETAEERKMRKGNHPKAIFLEPPTKLQKIGECNKVASIYIDAHVTIMKNDENTFFILEGRDPKKNSKILATFGNGVLYNRNLSAVLLDRVSTFLNKLPEDHKEAIANIGHATGRCCLCGRELSNEKSMKLGYGPVCLGRWVYI